MAYELDQFISDCRSILAGDPGPKGREQVRARLERLLQNPELCVPALRTGTPWPACPL